MKFLVVLFALAGLTAGLQPSLKYTYKYFGQTQTGIPEISSQGSAAAMRADVILEMDQRGHAIVTISSPLFAEINDELGCQWREEIDYQFAPLKDQSVTTMLQKPFEANLFGDEPKVLILQDEEPLWMTNVKKGILSSLRNQVVRANFDSAHQAPVLPHILFSEELQEVFEAEEDTIFGRCNVQYSVHEVPEALALRELPPLQTQYRFNENSQSSRAIDSSVQLIHITKTVDFEHCAEIVQLQRSSGEVHDTMGKGQYEWLGGRSSVTEYLVRGVPGALQIERVTVQGSYSANALGMTDEQLQTRTNQTLVLQEVQPNAKPTTLKSARKESSTWMQEILSPVAPPSASPNLPWVSYTSNASIIDGSEILTGIPQNPTEYEERVQLIVQNLEKASREMVAEKPNQQIKSGEIIEWIKEAAEWLEGLPIEKVKKIIEIIWNNTENSPQVKLQKKLLVDVLSAAATRPAVDSLIELAKEGKITKFQQLTASFTIYENMQDATALPEMMKFVMEFDMRKDPFVASSVMVNFARFVQRFCIDPNATTVNYAGALLGDEVCDKDLIVSQFVPHLEQIIEDESLTYERIVALQTMHKLGLASNIQIIAPIALGHRGSSSLLRTAAIYTLDRWCLPEQSKPQIVELLTKIYTNIAENPRVRTAALTVLSSWGPEINFFSRIARLSWSEPSQAMVASYRALVEAFARTQNPMFLKQNQAATSALRLIRRTVPSTKYPQIARQISYYMDRHLMHLHDASFAFFDHPVKNTNFDLFHYAMSSVNGFDMSLMDTMIMGGSLGPLKDTVPTNYESNDAHTTAANEFYKLIQDTVQAIPKQHFDAKDKVVSVYMRILDNMQIMAPLSLKTLEKLPIAKPAKLAKIIKKLEKGTQQLFGKFIVPMTLKQFYPNELGLPVIIQHKTAVAFSESIQLKASMSPRPKKIQELLPEKVNIEAEQYFKLLTQTTGEIQVYVPWSNSKLRSIVKSSRDVTVPLKAKVDVDIQALISKQGPPSYIEVVLSPAFQTKYPVVAASNRPLALIEQLSLSGPSRQPVVQEIISHSPIKKQVDMPQTYTGMQFSIDWVSELRYPFDILGLASMIQTPEHWMAQPKLYHMVASPTARMWDLQIKFDPSSSESKKIALVTSCILPSYNRGGPSPSSFVPLAQQQQQQAQGQSRSMPYPSTPGQKPFPRPELPELLPASAEVNSCNASISFIGEQVRAYEAVYGWSEPTYESGRKQVKAQLALTRSPIPQVDQEALSVCLDYKKQTPIISELDTMQTVLAKKLDTEVTKTMTVGCDGSDPVVSAHAVMKVSNERLQKLEQRTKECCEYDPYDPVNNLLRKAVYDDIQSSVTWQSVCENSRVPWMSKAWTALDLLFMRPIETVACDAVQSPNKFDFALKKSVETEMFDFAMSRGSDKFEIESIPTSPMAEYALSVRTIANPLESALLYVRQSGESDKCVVGKDHVRTFDGNTFNYTASSCWTVVATDCMKEQFVVYARSSSSSKHPVEARIIDRKEGVVVEILDSVKVNGVAVEPVQFVEKVLNVDGKIIAEVSKQNGHYMVKLPGRPLVAVKETVEVRIPCHFEICGVCGTMNVEPAADMVGPKQCMHNDADVFVASWTGKGDQCDVSSLEQRRSKVEQFQKTCSKISQLEQLELPQQKYTPFQYEYGYRVMQHKQQVCVSMSPMANCDPLSPQQQPQVIPMGCWLKSQSPAVLRDALRRSVPQVPQPISATPQEILRLPVPRIICQPVQ